MQGLRSVGPRRYRFKRVAVPFETLALHILPEAAFRNAKVSGGYA